MISWKTERDPGLHALNGIQSGNGLGIFFQPCSTQGTRALELQWKFQWNIDACSQEQHTAPTYIRDLVTPVNEISGRSHLRSATLGHFDVPRTRTKLGSRAFSVAGPVA